MAAKPTETVAVKVRMKERLRRDLEVEANRDGISVNAAIERRLNRTLIDDKVMDIIQKVAKETSDYTADRFAKAMFDNILKQSREIAGQFAKVDTRLDQIDRLLSLHELILNAKKGDVSNG
jgi:hypothetical protein